MLGVSVRQPSLTPGFSIFFVIGHDLHIVHSAYLLPRCLFRTVYATTLEMFLKMCPMKCWLRRRVNGHCRQELGKQVAVADTGLRKCSRCFLQDLSALMLNSRGGGHASVFQNHFIGDMLRQFGKLFWNCFALLQLSLSNSNEITQNPI